jgi:hypothetical protein
MVQSEAWLVNNTVFICTILHIGTNVKKKYIYNKLDLFTWWENYDVSLIVYYFKIFHIGILIWVIVV